MKKIALACCLLAVTACSTNTFKSEPVTVKALAPTLTPSIAPDYIANRTPLDRNMIALPFLFDGDVVLSNDFDLATWDNKRFLSLLGEFYYVDERFVVNMESGKITSATREIEFEMLLQNLIINILPLKKYPETPKFLVLTHLTTEEDKGSILVIEDPETNKVHGFIETPYIN